MSRPNLNETALKLAAMIDVEALSDDDRRTLEDAARELAYAQREIDYLTGQRDAAKAGMDLTVRRIAAITGCLWPGPVSGPDGAVYDGSPEMKIQAHDAARAVSTQKLAEWP